MRRRHLLASGLVLASSGLALAARAQGSAPAAPATPAAPAAPVAGEMRRTHALSLLGEPGLPADFPHWPWVNPNAPKGGEMVLAAIGSFDSLNPFILRGTAAGAVVRIYDTLLAPSMDEASTEYAHLAASIEVPADRRGVTFVLHDKARWHDGKPVTADDVVWTFNALREKGRPFYRAYWGDVAEVVADGPKRAVFRFSTDQNRELGLILGQMPVLPKHFWEGKDFAQPGLEVPLGSGPYKVERFEAGRSIVLKRVPDYWGRDLPTMKGTNNLDTLRYEYFRDATVAFQAFKAGQVEFRQENIAKDWATAYDFPAVRQGQVKRDEIRHELPTGMQGFAMNTRRPLFQDRRVREALGLMFDFEWMNANLFYGSYTRTSSYFSNSELAATGLPSEGELLILSAFRGRVPEELFTSEFRVPVSDGQNSNREAARKALGLLKDAGWTVKDRRLVNEQNQPFAFEILLDSPTFERVALPYVQSLQRLGIEARVRTVDAAQYQKRTDEFDFDMTVDLIPQSLSPGNEQRDFWSSEKAKEPGSRNLIGVSDPVVDALVELVVNAPDRQALIDRCRALDRVLLWSYYVVPHWHSRVFRAAWWDKFGRPERNPRYGLDLMSWWVEPARDRALPADRKTMAQ
ncbi:ABC transporter substrate-binding protein [Pseudoroseomonas wenyumeiae]|uniref:ABC transporter substrate-binding protein n=2 Tax=Teichococcus wenyumeiae TaxID=2478470 RepID=A0ABX9VMY8_9PROT|nr:extracellular solute-binding protein [Pseudoroseomonas wenyumeiae]RMI25399.1 ABC transporter substrate-binding protein [Pseudoroseomonas wenyumeiae]